jgi:chemosensory pili system protein ChpA (sensor histidine kinase/response regulator)
MNSFSIDDVKDTMPREVTAFLTTIENSALEFFDKFPVATHDEESRGSEILRTIRHCGHAILGTSSLVSVKTLAECADLVERLAERAHTELAEAELRQSRARRFIELLPTGVEQMRTVLELALRHEDDEAEWLVAEWQNDASKLLEKLTVVPIPAATPSLHPTVDDDAIDSTEPVLITAGLTDTLKQKPSDGFLNAVSGISDLTNEIEFLDESEAPAGVPVGNNIPSNSSSVVDEFSFADWEPETAAKRGKQIANTVDEDAQFLDTIDDDRRELDIDEEFKFDEDSAQVGHVELQTELLSIFQEEAKEAVVALQGFIDALAYDATRLDIIESLERTYHTLKGASATVGLTDVSQLAEALQFKAEGLIGVSNVIERSTLQSFVDETNHLFSRANLNDIRICIPESSSDRRVINAPHLLQIFPEFIEEVREIHQQAAALVAELSSPTGVKYTQSILATLAPLFHRLKGSARLVGNTIVADVAQSLEEDCNGATVPTSASLSLGLARIATNLGLLEKPTPKTEERVEVLDATQREFEEEARGLFDEALKLTQQLREVRPSEGAAQKARSELAKLFHHLGGSALIVGNAEVAAEARSIEGILQNEKIVSSGDILLVDQRLAKLRAQFAPTSFVESVTSTASLLTEREPVVINQDQELWVTFTTECAELMESIEHIVLKLDDSSSPREQLQRLMRSVHTLKGVINTIGLTPTGKVLHRVEDLLESLTTAAIVPPARRITSIILDVQSEVRRNLREAPSGYVETSLRRLEERIRLLFTSKQDLSQDSMRSSPTGVQASNEIHSDDSFASNSAASLVGSGDRRVIRIATERLDALMNLAGELVVNRSRLTSRVQRLQSLQLELAHGGRRLLDAVDDFREEHEFAHLDGKNQSCEGTTNFNLRSYKNDVAGAPIPAWGAFSELELDRYEGIHILSRSLAELASDFSEIHSQLAFNLSAFADDADVVGGLVSNIQSEITRARMVPLESLFLRLRLPVHDAALRERKEVRITLSGEGVPVDKSIADALFQPLLHLVRNAVVHGIESTEARERRGKPREGTVSLNARQESGQIVVEVRDDGAGLDLGALRARGISMGFLDRDIPVDHPRVLEMVFAQGLSTQSTVGDVAGRGVGGEVVKRAIDRLNGSIRIESTKDKGTAFIIRLPLTLAITRALIVRYGMQAFAIPLHFSERIIDSQEQAVVSIGDSRRIKLDGVYLPVRTLNEFMGADSIIKQDGPVLILNVGDTKIALQVDSIVAHEEIVVKNLGALLSGHPLFASITIRGTGELVLILDVPSLVDAKGTRIDQQPGRGDVNVPVRVVANDKNSTPNKSLGRANQDRPSQRKWRVLFVDDSLSVRKVAEMLLKELGVDVITAVDGVEAMAKLRNEKVDLVFTDLEMPRMNGYELIRELRFLPVHKSLPIVVVTSRSGRKHQDQAQKLGASEYLTKPFTSQSLEAAMKRWILHEVALVSDVPDYKRTPL